MARHRLAAVSVVGAGAHDPCPSLLEKLVDTPEEVALDAVLEEYTGGIVPEGLAAGSHRGLAAPSR